MMKPLKPSKWKYVNSLQPTLAFFDVSKHTVLQTDASATGIGFALLQDGKPVLYGSKALQSNALNYVAIEK